MRTQCRYIADALLELNGETVENNYVTHFDTWPLNVTDMTHSQLLEIMKILRHKEG
jgi:hypothetical protein